jgi:hypothetical protein
MNRSKFLAAALLAWLPLGAHAKGWYVGLEAGRTEADAKIEEHLIGGGVTAEDSGTSSGINLSAGYQFGRFFGMELSYADFGDYEYSFDPDDCPFGNPGPCPFSVSTSFTGFAFSLVGIVPVGERWSLHGRFGVYNMKADSRELAGADLRDSSHEEGFKFGLGAGLKLDEHWQFLLDYSSYQQLDFGLASNVVGDFGTYDVGDTTLLAIGINYHW